MPRRNAVISIGTVPVPIGDPAAGLILQNVSTVVIYIGGPSVTADKNATGGLQLAASGAPFLVPNGFFGGAQEDPNLYAVVASGTADLAVVSGV